MNELQLPAWWHEALASPYWRVAIIMVGALLVSLVARLLVVPFLRRLAHRTASDLDDRVLDLLWPAIFRTIILQGVHMAALDLFTGPLAERVATGVTMTLMVLIWGRVLSEGGSLVFARLSANADRFTWVQPQTLPLVQFAYKVLVFGLLTYLVMSAWRIDLTSWLASAGVVGIAVGFAAKDTLANFISGVFILADAPYRVGQYIIIDGETRGVVTEIGMRSTRLLTRDNVEVTVPNAVISNAKIVNESSGPAPRMRVRVNVGVAYGSDIDRVRELLLGCAGDLELADNESEPTVRFIAMGESSLDFQVLVWVEHPVYRGRVVDELNTKVYRALTAAGIEIPFPQRDLHVKSWPEKGLPGTAE